MNLLPLDILPPGYDEVTLCEEAPLPSVGAKVVVSPRAFKKPDIFSWIDSLSDWQLMVPETVIRLACRYIFSGTMSSIYSVYGTEGVRQYLASLCQYAIELHQKMLGL